MTPRSSPCRARAGTRRRGVLLGASALAFGCVSRSGGFETVTTLPEPARHPAGADIELTSKLPQAERRGDTQAGLLVLETPADPAQARAVIAAFFRAIVSESPPALGTVLAPSATLQEGARKESAVAAWSSRFTRFDYRSLANERLYRDSEVTIREDERDLWVGVPIEVAWGARPRLLADLFTFHLTPSGAGWSISEILEEFRSP